MKKKAIILLSGGLDSITVLALAKSQGYRCYALSFDYGQRHNSELVAAHNIAEVYNVVEHKVIDMGLGSIGGSALTDNKIAVPDLPQEGIPVTYVPARNTIFLSFALGWAEVLHCTDIFIGVNALDYSGYPDCRPKYIEAFQIMGRLATKSGIEEKEQLQIHTPLIKMKKSEIIKTGIVLDVDYSITHSCYDPISKGQPCGRCDACQLRLKGFAEAGTVDPLNYPEIQL